MNRDRLGPYRLEERLGKGGMAEVYRAFDERLDRPVAIKHITKTLAKDGRERERFWREARAVARLSHPAIVDVYDIVQNEDGDWIVMELVEGRTLSEVLENGPVEVAWGAALLREVAEGLAEAHGKGLLHRDLKTENVMVTDQGHGKILDFGLARSIGSELEESSLTVAGRVIGTPRAMSPEQAMGRDLDPRSDLFSLGTLIYETLAGRNPFDDSAGVVATVRRVCFEPHRSAREVNSRIPEELSRLIDRLLEKDPEARPRDASTVAQALERLTTARPEEGDETLETPAIRARPPGDGQSDVRQVVRDSAGAGPTGHEHRQITLLRCSPSAEAATGAPGEEAGRLRERVDELVRRFDGRVGKSPDPVAGGFLVYFGYPRAQEDATRRAVYAARDLVAKAGHLRAAIHSGPALVRRKRGSEPELLLGETETVVGELEGLAQPGEILLSAATRRIVAPFFRTEEVTAGIAWRYLGERISSGSTDAVGPLVARQQELELLLDRWKLVQEGQGQVVLLMGEAGIGKTRLISALRNRVPEKAATWWQCQCSQLESDTPFAPIVDLLHRLLSPEEETPATTEVDWTSALEGLATSAGLPTDVVPFLADLVGISGSISAQTRVLSPRLWRQRTLEALLELVQAMADRQPILMVVEDMQWVDPSTLELIELLAEQGEAVPLFLVLTSRLELETTWAQRSYMTQLTLSRLNREQVGTMIRQLAGTVPMATAIEEAIARRTDGVPLFIEEVTYAVLEATVDSAVSVDSLPVTVPPSLQDFLSARLDRLGRAKALAQKAAVLGRAFTSELLQEIAGLDEAELADLLDRLVRTEVVHRRGMGSRARYLFKHALSQEAAYLSLPKAERRELHRAIAEKLESRFPALVQGQPEVLAYHRTQAGQGNSAIELWSRASQLAIGRSAHQEAIGHLKKGLKVLASLPRSPDHVRQEVGLQLALGNAWTAAAGYGAPQVREAFRRARDLCRDIGETPHLFPVFLGLFKFYSVRGDLGTARELAERLLRLAEDSGDTAALAEAHRVLGMSFFHLGEQRIARTHLDESRKLYEPDLHRDRALRHGTDSGVVTLSYSALAAWLCGRPDHALATGLAAIGHAREIRHPFSLSYALQLTALVRLLRGDDAEALALAEEVLDVAAEFPHWRAMGTIVRGRVRAHVKDHPRLDHDGDVEAGIAEMRVGLEAYRGTGAELMRTFFLGLLAGTCMRGRPATDQGEVELGLVNEGLTVARRSGERWWEAELLRLKGEVTLRRDATADLALAEESFRQALEVARTQGALSLELRAALSLGRLRRATARPDEARSLLAAVFDRFDEGFDTVDLREARVLLDQL